MKTSEGHIFRGCWKKVYVCVDFLDPVQLPDTGRKSLIEKTGNWVPGDLGSCPCSVTDQP